MSSTRVGSKRRSTSGAPAAPVTTKKVRKSIVIPETIEYQHEEPGSIAVVGDGDTGQLGLGPDVTEKTRPALVPGLDNIVQIAAGGMHTVALTSDFKIITFGCNDEGALGRETSVEGSETSPGEVEIPDKIVQISAGDSHSAALTESGLLYVWGTFRDTHGSMGLINKEIQKKPLLIQSDIKFTKVASGAHHLILLGIDGNVYSSGCGEQGQLGRLSERTANRNSRRGLKSLLTPALVTIGRPIPKIQIVNVWTGSYNTFTQDKSGNIYVFGLNNYNQLGNNDAEVPVYFHPFLSKSFGGKNWTKISGGEHHTMALDDKGIVYTLGRKEYGRLGLGEDSPDAVIPTEVKIEDGVKCIDISCGSFTSFALTESGKLYSWGMASSMLGHGDEEDKFLPTLVKGKQIENKKITQVAGGGQHTVVILKNQET